MSSSLRAQANVAISGKRCMKIKDFYTIINLGIKRELPQPVAQDSMYANITPHMFLVPQVEPKHSHLYGKIRFPLPRRFGIAYRRRQHVQRNMISW